MIAMIASAWDHDGWMHGSTDALDVSTVSVYDQLLLTQRSDHSLFQNIQIVNTIGIVG